MDIENRVSYLLQVSNFPKIPKIEYKERFPQLVSFLKNPKPIHFKCGSITTRKIARSVAVSVAIDFLYESRTKYPPCYFIKPSFIETFRNIYFNNKTEILEQLRERSIIIFDGVDEASTSQEMTFISSFLSPLILEQKPLLLLSCGRLNEEMISKYNAYSFGTLFLDTEEIFF